MSSFIIGNNKVSIFDKMDDLLFVKWNEIKPVTLNSEYLSLLEQSKPKDITFYYVLIENSTDKNEVVGIMYFQLQKFTGKNLSIQDSAITSFLSSLILRIRPFRILICGNLFAVNFPSIEYKKEKISVENILEIIDELKNKIRTDVVLLKDLGDEFTKSRMINQNWTPYDSDLTMTLSIDPLWNSLEDYESSLSKKYRKRTIKILTAGEEMIRKELTADDIKFYSDDIRKLFDLVRDKQMVTMGLIDESYFINFKEKFPETFFMTGYFIGKRMVAFNTYIDHGDVLEMHYIGIDYSLNKKLMIYFNILFDGVRKAIAMRKKTLELGRTAREAKANLGCTPVYFNDYIRFNSGLASRLSALYARYFQKSMGETWKERHPFAVKK